MDDTTWQASINDNAIPGESYPVDQFYNGIGTINGVTSGRIIGNGCNVAFKDSGGATRCVLSSGNYTGVQFINECGNDVVTQYTVHSSGIIYANRNEE